MCEMRSIMKQPKKDHTIFGNLPFAGIRISCWEVIKWTRTQRKLSTPWETLGGVRLRIFDRDVSVF
ncbi:hypothetical protein YC2023_105822 [Brassica napus]